VLRGRGLRLTGSFQSLNLAGSIDPINHRNQLINGVNELQDRCFRTHGHLQTIDQTQHFNRRPYWSGWLQPLLLPNIRQTYISAVKTNGKRHRTTPGRDSATSVLVVDDASLDRIG
jgi:hypothetical protein